MYLVKWHSEMKVDFLIQNNPRNSPGQYWLCRGKNILQCKYGLAANDAFLRNKTAV